MEEDEEGIEMNRVILKLLVKGKGREGIDETDNVNSATPLIAACENIYDVEIIKILCEGGADVNAVNTDDKMPLSIINERLQKDMTNTKLESIYEYL